MLVLGILSEAVGGVSPIWGAFAVRRKAEADLRATGRVERGDDKVR